MAPQRPTPPKQRQEEEERRQEAGLTSTSLSSSCNGAARIKSSSCKSHEEIRRQDSRRGECCCCWKWGEGEGKGKEGKGKGKEESSSASPCGVPAAPSRIFPQQLSKFPAQSPPARYKAPQDTKRPGTSSSETSLGSASTSAVSSSPAARDEDKTSSTKAIALSSSPLFPFDPLPPTTRLLLLLHDCKSSSRSPARESQAADSFLSLTRQVVGVAIGLVLSARQEDLEQEHRPCWLRTQ
eukprot:750609-Hanusia_phi.AAC.9